VLDSIATPVGGVLCTAKLMAAYVANAVVAALTVNVTVFWPAGCAVLLIFQYRKAYPAGSVSGAVSVTLVPDATDLV
jgi:hypothetical protein